MPVLTQKPYKPYIVPTLYGLAYFFLILNIFALGYYRSSSPFHTVGLTMSILGLVAMIQSNDSMKNLSLDLLGIEAGAEGSRARLRLCLNKSDQEVRYHLQLEAEKTLHAEQATHVALLEDRIAVDLNLSCRQRGIYSLERIKVFSRGLFGLFYTWTWLPIDAELVVYPRAEGTLPLPTSPDESSGASAAGEDFAGHRPYQLGVSPKHIDWKALARRDLLLVKDYQKQGEGAVHLAIAEIPGHDTEAKLRQLAAWCLACRMQQKPFSLDLGISFLDRGSNEAHLSSALRLLAAYKASR